MSAGATGGRSAGREGIAITGTAAWSCHGHGVAPILAALAGGTRVLQPNARFEPHGAPLAALPGFEATGWRPGPGLAADPWNWAVEIAVAVALTAAAQARLGEADYQSDRVAVINGTTHGSNRTLESVRSRLAGAEQDPILYASSPSIVARRIARSLDARGPALTLNTACSSSLNGIGQAVRLLRSGEVDCVVAGGNDIVSYVTLAGFNSLRALSRAGCRPFDVELDGLTLGDGAAYLVLEREAAARARGVRPLGHVVGYANAAEGYHATAPAPDGRGARQVMERALAGAIEPRRLAWISTHGTGTPVNDVVELQAIGWLLDQAGIPGPVDAFSLKSWFGHTLGAAGALEAVTTLHCMRGGLLPGTAGLASPLPHDPRLRLAARPRTTPEVPIVALCNSFGFGGNVASLCLQIDPKEG